MSEPSKPSAPVKSDPAGAAAKPSRNPIERVVVWGLIAALLVVTAVEGRARLGYSQSLSKLQAAMAAAESDNTSSFKIDQIPALLSGSPAESHDTQGVTPVAHYQWKGLFKSYGLHVKYGKFTKVVMGVTSDDPPAEQPPVGPAPVAGGSPASTASVPAEDEPRREPEGGGGRPSFDPLQADADGDGKLSREEAPGRMAENFDAIDTNQDGFLDAAEIEARPRRGGGPRPGGTGAGERSRPQSEAPAPETTPSSEALPADAPASEPPAAPAAN